MLITANYLLFSFSLLVFLANCSFSGGRVSPLSPTSTECYNPWLNKAAFTSKQGSIRIDWDYRDTFFSFLFLCVCGTSGLANHTASMLVLGALWQKKAWFPLSRQSRLKKLSPDISLASNWISNCRALAESQIQLAKSVDGCRRNGSDRALLCFVWVCPI